VAVIGVPPSADAQPSGSLSGDATRILSAIAEVVLPGELGAGGRRQALTDFVRWVENYREGAETDHGYGVTRLRRTSASPASGYATQLASLQAAASGRFPDLPPAERRALVEKAIAAARIDRLPSRPTGAHIAADLMAHYFNSPAATDLCYGAEIGRERCRGLAGSDQRPSPVR